MAVLKESQIEQADRARLQQICFLKTDSEKAVVPLRANVAVRAEERQRMESHLLRQYSRESWPKGFYQAACPHPILVHPQHYQNIQALHEALVLAITNIVERWWTDSVAKFPERMPLEPQEEDLLRWMADEAADAVRPYNQCLGSWRPDFLIDEATPGAEPGSVEEQFVICEINARFSFNGFCVSAAGQQGLSDMGNEEKGLLNVLEPDQVVKGLLSLFDPTRPLHLLKGEEYGIDIHLFAVEVERRTGTAPKFITPDDLRLLPCEDSEFGYKLCALAKDETRKLPASHRSARFIHNAEVLEEIHQVGLELHQRELRALSSEMLRQLALRCFNDLRTVFLVHDKRMLGIVLQELDALVGQHGVLSEDQARMLRDGIAETFIPGSPELEEFVLRCKSQPEAKDGYLLKPIRSGKGAGIIFGDEASEGEWKAKLDGLRRAALTPGETSYIVQRQARQPTYPVLLSEDGGLQHNRMIGTFMAAHGKFLGLGIWRCGPERICAVSHGGAFMFSVMSSHHRVEKASERWSMWKYFRWLHSIGSWVRRRFAAQSV
ncbi:hypothetical protein CPC735_019130 [Coccidioides posadasii C735 delta SOWgp]|uniref:Uncharacterized protein n=1 Tax=Coccidioides posadasii (strain C735) TaxID=222929 RepID=C5PDZ8_COCP7|nr:hypothetical protein CPC735_019130 [Coccidioides posadasii C735 delta SOWgp]EER25309.1 hypothetical protein CPC735_019130 [Coccidioides posadasii C735 delta SOWgp]|eukprot:XP_003067454.1 hypothetical protein CPC735_019130 [Coccidioides posadasii C735 delta SOWgp]